MSEPSNLSEEEMRLLAYVGFQTGVYNLPLYNDMTVIVTGPEGDLSQGDGKHFPKLIDGGFLEEVSDQGVKVTARGLEVLKHEHWPEGCRRYQEWADNYWKEHPQPA